ncbi:serine/threonine protein kinase, partial [Pseudomonas syringae pv. tagetis]
NFWSGKKLQYRLAKQDHAAPLIYLIAGTGAPYNSTINEILKKLYYGAGNHGVQLTSPTSYDFMRSASPFSTTGISS